MVGVVCQFSRSLLQSAVHIYRIAVAHLFLSQTVQPVTGLIILAWPKLFAVLVEPSVIVLPGVPARAGRLINAGVYCVPCVMMVCYGVAEVAHRLRAQRPRLMAQTQITMPLSMCRQNPGTQRVRIISLRQKMQCWPLSMTSSWFHSTKS